MIGAKQYIDANVKHIEVLTGEPPDIVRNIKFCEIFDTVVSTYIRPFTDYLLLD